MQSPSDDAFIQWSSSLLFSLFDVVFVTTSSARLIMALVCNVKVLPSTPVYVLVIVYVSFETADGLEIDTLAVLVSNVSQLGSEDPLLWAKVILFVKLAVDAAVTTS